jgi:hypothetical protein
MGFSDSLYGAGDTQWRIALAGIRPPAGERTRHRSLPVPFP